MFNFGDFPFIFVQKATGQADLLPKSNGSIDVTGMVLSNEQRSYRNELA